MGLYDYQLSQSMYADDYPFHALIMCAMRKADSDNARRLVSAFPEVWEELSARYRAPGGILPDEEP